MATIHPKIHTELNRLTDELAAEGALPSQEQLERYYSTFRREFGPDVLRGLDGEQLLERMHAHGTRDSLVYWLEFKDDDEFPALFGSIAGGSALKFGVFRRKETGVWATKGESNYPKDISVEEAVQIARKHRDQLLAACDTIAASPEGAEDDVYRRLEEQLRQVAPDIQDTAWGHKYLSLIFPDALDDFHVVDYQQYHLVRMLELPPNWDAGYKAGRYACAGRYVRLAGEVDVSLKILTLLLNRRNGNPRNYWRIGTKQDGEERRAVWPLLLNESVVGVGWAGVGDLSGISKKDRERLAASLRDSHGLGASDASKGASQLLRFVLDAQEGDRVIASDGQSVLGVGEITGPYAFSPSSTLPHQREVRWHSTNEWRAVDADPLNTRIARVRDMRNHIEIERHLLEEPTPVSKPTSPSPAPSSGRRQLGRLSGAPGLIQAILERKGQVILYGPPGTGKTYWAIQAAQELAARRTYGVSYGELEQAQRDRIAFGTREEPALVRTSSFHPEYGYEDFIEGYRPSGADNGNLTFELKPGVFKRLCQDASRAPELDFYLIVDEINRGDVPRIFGELLTLLERDKRGHPVELPASGNVFRVPSNVFVIGTMNTADRSIALLDTALRRRFGFVELMPDYSTLQGASVTGLPLGAWLEDLNSRVRSMGGGDARNRQVGHAFLLDRGSPISRPEQLVAVIRDDIVPLLEEYCYDDFNQLVELLGSKLVDAAGQRIRRELFAPGRADDLVAALMRPEITTAAAAVIADEADGEDPEAEGGEEVDSGDSATSAA